MLVNFYNVVFRLFMWSYSCGSVFLISDQTLMMVMKATSCSGTFVSVCFVSMHKEGSIWIFWGAVITSNVLSTFHQVWWWNSRPQQWQRALCQVGEVNLVKQIACLCVNGVWAQHWYSTSLLAATHIFLFFLLLYSFLFFSNFWAFVLVGWFYFQVFGRRSEFCR